MVVGLSFVANAVIAIARNKVLAVLLGPRGVGFIAQLVGFQSLASGVLPMGMQVGALRFVARHRDDEPERMASFLRTTAVLFVAISLVSLLVCLVLVRPLSRWVLDDAAAWPFLVAPLLGVPFLVQAQLWQTFVQAGLDVKTYSKTLVVPAMIGLVPLLVLVAVWHEGGGAAHLLLAAIVTYAVAAVYARRAMRPELRAALKTARLGLEAARYLGGFTAANLPVIGLTLLVPFLVRTQIVHDRGMVANGIYQAVFAISSQYLSIPLNAIATYALPKMSQRMEHGEMNVEINNSVHASILFAGGGILALLVCRDWVIRILFSSEFLPAVALFPLQMVGDLFRAVGFAIQQPLLPMGLLFPRFVLALVQNAVFLGVFFAAPPERRVEAAVLAHAAGWATQLVTHYVFLRRVTGFRFSGHNGWMLLVSAGAVGCLALTPVGTWASRLGGVVVIGIWAAVCVRKSDVQFVWERIRARALPGAAAQRGAE